MFGRRRRPPDEPVTDPMGFLGATYHAIPFGCWVYTLHQADDHIFYVGKSTGPISRLRDHQYKYGLRLHHYALISCRDEYEMELNEHWLINQLQKTGQAEENYLGTAEVERQRWIRRKQTPNGTKGMSPGHLLGKTGTEYP